VHSALIRSGDALTNSDSDASAEDFFAFVTDALTISPGTAPPLTKTAQPSHLPKALPSSSISSILSSMI
jgi:hypothetical protein